MKYWILTAALVLLVAGCGGKSKEQASESSETTDIQTSTPIDGGVRAMNDAKAVTARRDCDGTCGQVNFPPNQLTEVDGKYYCPLCVEAAKQAGEQDGK